MTIAQGFLAYFDPEMKNTRRMLERVPDEALDYKPHPKSMAMGKLAGHIAEMVEWGATTAAHDSFDIQPPDGPPLEQFSPTSVKEILERFDNAVAQTAEAVAAVDDDGMRQQWTLFKAGSVIFAMPRIAVLQTMILSHMVHHRAQLGVYLRLNDIPIPGMYGPSADEPQG